MVEDQIQHYGVKRRSGRYPWGSGKNPQRSLDFYDKVNNLKKQGMSTTDIQKHLGLTSTQYRTEITLANQAKKQALADSFKSMRERGMSNSEIARHTGSTEGTVRNYLKENATVLDNQLETIADRLADSVERTGYLDVGKGVERQIGISKEKMAASKQLLLDNGYYEHEIYVRRLNDRTKSTTISVLTKEKDLEVVKKNADKIKAVDFETEDGGRTALGLDPIKDVSSKKVKIRYAEDGGEDMDGVIELRKGAKDLDLGNARYAQVRISVDGTHYLKGMAMYSDDLPKGVDIRFNTNKTKDTPKMKVLKEQKLDTPDNPFGATIQKRKGALNIVNEEGDWDKWSKTLSAQFLSKQPTNLVKERVDATFKKMQDDYSTIMSMTNSAVRKKLLDGYISEVDSKIKHLKTVALPNTRGQVLLPFPKMNVNEVYAPNYKNGEKVVLVRYPHGGIFELPELTVNNKGPARKVIPNAKDAIGIHPSVARKLSGADFDGDTVYVMPNNNRKIKTAKSLKELKNFDPNSYYAGGRTTISPKTKQIEMGKVSNLITDMTIKGATTSELARAVRHSMVVIDSEKHKLDYKKSAEDNGINALKKKYQQHISPVTGKKSVGASTLISRSKKGLEVGGEVVEYIDKKTGKTKKTTINSKNVSLVDMFSDAKVLSSGTAVENIYANYINKAKILNNKARKSYSAIPNTKRNPVAARKYVKEVASLDKKLNTALLNAPRERRAQILASNTYFKNIKPGMSKDEIKRLKTQAILAAREKTGAKRKPIKVSDSEWNAIQSGAISDWKLRQILDNADLEVIKKHATPKAKPKVSAAKASRAKAMLSTGNYTQAEVAESLGISVSSLRNLLE